MKPKKSVALATWMLKRLTVGHHNEALLGDLLEEFRGGRSVGWYWRQVVCAIGIGVVSRCRDYALPLFFSTGWSMFYPVWWLCIVKTAALTQPLFERLAATDWPYSTGLHGISEIIPAATFVWLGLFIYLMRRSERAHKVSRLRLFGSLSISLNVLVVTTVGLGIYSKASDIRLSYVAHKNFSINSHLIAISVPLVLSLLSAISFALSSTQGRRRWTASVGG